MRLNRGIAFLLALVAASASALELDSSNGRFRVELSPPAGGWPLNRQFVLPFRLKAAKPGLPVPADLKIDVDASMPAHRHGSNLTPAIRQVGEGDYRITGLLLHMKGEWKIRLTLTAGTTVDEVVIPIQLD